MKKPILLILLGFGLGWLVVDVLDVIRFKYFDTGSMPMGMHRDE